MKEKKPVNTQPIHVRKEIHRRVKTAASEEGRSIGEWTERALVNRLDEPSPILKTK